MIATPEEDASTSSRLDMAVRIAGHVYLFEFKIVGKPGAGEGENAAMWFGHL